MIEAAGFRRDEFRKAQGLPPEVPEAELRDRLRRLQAAMERRELDGILIYGSPTRPSWIRYLANYIHPFVAAESLLLVDRSDEPILFIDRPWYLQTAREMSYIRDIRVLPYVDFAWQFDDLVAVFSASLSDRGLKEGRLAVSREVSATHFDALRRAAPDAELVLSNDALGELITTWSSYDKEMMIKTAEIADAGMETALRGCKEGVPEYVVGLGAEETMASMGGEYGPGATARDHIYVASAGTLISNVRAYNYTSRKLERGDMFFIDLAVCYHGYYVDFCRTVCIGSPTRSQLRIFDCVVESYNALQESLRPGISGAAMFEIDNRVTDGYGLSASTNLVWLGHATGIFPAYRPYFQRGETEEVVANSFFNIEPGVFVPGEAVVSIEDCFYVDEERATPLTNCTRELWIA